MRIWTYAFAMLLAMTLSWAMGESCSNDGWSSWWPLIQTHLTVIGSRVSFVLMSQRRLKSGCWGLRGCVPDTVLSTDLPSSPIVIVPVVRLCLLQSAWRMRRVPEIPASSLPYVL